jgi:glycosyltransferase involved in cell wall biosynthesis
LPFEISTSIHADPSLPVKVLQVNYSDVEGGAAIAAYRLHQALRRYGVDSRMLLARAVAGDWTARPMDGASSKLVNSLRRQFTRIPRMLLQTENETFHSFGLLHSRWPRELSRSDADVTNLHWVGAEMMSIADIGRLRGPLVWTLHDMWAFCGAEHHTDDFRWRDGYARNNRPAYESGLDLNRWTWLRKLKHWRNPIHIVASSQWLADCVSQSPIMSEWPVTRISLAIDTEVWRPIEKSLARKLLRLPDDRRILVFSAAGGTRDPNKGFDLLLAALTHLRGQLLDLDLVIIGQLPPKEVPDLGFPMHFVGKLHEDVSRCLYYNAADAIVVPSRRESFSLVTAEAHSCGIPTIAFDITALSNIIEHQVTGYLARPYDTQDLAAGIQWVLVDSERRAMLGGHCRRTAIEKFSYPVVAEQYSRLYRSICTS